MTAPAQLGASVRVKMQHAAPATTVSVWVSPLDQQVPSMAVALTYDEGRTTRLAHWHSLEDAEAIAHALLDAVRAATAPALVVEVAA